MGPILDLRRRDRPGVAAMNLDNFVIARSGSWLKLTPSRKPGQNCPTRVGRQMAHEVAGLPSQLEPEPEEAKRFDLLFDRHGLAGTLTHRGAAA